MDSKVREINPTDTIKNKLGMLTKKGNEHGERRENEKNGNWKQRIGNWVIGVITLKWEIIWTGSLPHHAGSYLKCYIPSWTLIMK